LSTNGALASVILGTLAMTAGVRWGALLVGYFVSATGLSRWKHGEKSARTASIVQKTGARDAFQVLANGVVYVVVALAATIWNAPALAAAALGAIAAAMADTSATEIGGAVGGPPRSLTSGKRIAAGLSGGVTLFGTLAMVAGSALVGMFGRLLGFGAVAAWSAFAGGIAGALADSLLGSTLQERRQCPACGVPTERRLHNCQPAGVETMVVGGIRRLDNDWVNLTSTAIAAVVAAIFSRGGA
ncbi:MAG: DUF92 domain-containing protein, partial [Gemmatimonadaceae bacterium]